MTTSQWRLIVPICCAVIFGCNIGWAAPNDRPPFYQIQWQGKSAYLLGSIHIGSRDFYPLPSQIEAAFERAQALVVEVDMTKVDSSALLQKYGMADKTQGLDWLSRDQQTVEAMTSYCATVTNLCQSIQHFAPWLQASQVNLMRYKALGYSSDYGVDMQLLGRKVLPVFELETAASQFQLFDSFNSQIQWSMVREAISVSDAELLSLIRVWRSGDEAALDALIQEQMVNEGDTQILDKFLWQRNHTMADGIIKLMNSEASTAPLFIVIGAGHVVGDKSVVQLLKQSGAKVTACWREFCQ